MERRRFGRPKTHVAVIGQGTWYIDEGDRVEAVATLRRGIDLGMTHIDTAEMYGDAEELVGEAIAGRRADVFLVSKVLPANASRRGTVKACERSLKKLGTDHLDCYLLHWRGEYPLAETFAGFDHLVRDGKIASWGVSNFDVADLEEAEAAVPHGIACNQVLYHLQERAIEHAVLPWCETHGVALVAYSPLGHGKFPGRESKGGRVLQAIADAHAATPRQVALSFLVRQPQTFAIPKASTLPHARENARAGDCALTSDEIASIDKAFPRGPRRTRLPML